MGGPIVLKSIKPNVPDDVLNLWRLPREKAEAIYAEAFRRDDRQAVRWLAKNDRYFLLTCLLRRPDVRDDWLYARCREVEADPDDYIDLWSREHYKSSIITFAGIIQEVLNDPEITIAIFSHDRPTSRQFLNNIKTEVEENPLLNQVFPEIFWQNPKKQARKWSEDGIVLQRKGNPKELTVEAWGVVQGMPTGRHFGLMVYDDLVTEENVTNSDMIKETTNRWGLSRYLGKRGGRTWMVGTRYHYADTYGVILKRGVFTERRHAATHNGEFDGNPVFLTQKQWDRKRAEDSKQNVASQMLLNPIAGAETSFDIRQLQFWAVRPKVCNCYITVDPSKGKSATSDNTAIVITLVDTNRNRYVVDGWCHRMNLSKRWQVVRDAYKRWSRMPGIESVWVGYEEIGMQTDIEFFQIQMEQERFSFPIEALKWPRSGPKAKRHRIERLEPEVRMGRLRLPAVIEIDEEGNIHPRAIEQEKAAQEAIKNGEKWRVARTIHKTDEDGRIYDFLAKFLEEFMFFPAAPYDDILDGLSRIYDMMPVPPVVIPDAAGITCPEVFEDGI